MEGAAGSDAGCGQSLNRADFRAARLGVPRWKVKPLRRDRPGTFLVLGERMCLGVPGRIVEIDGLVATVDFFGVRRTVRLDVVDEPVSPGDYILNHVGFAIRRIPEREIGETLALYEQLLREAESDIMAADVRSEIEAGREDHGNVP